ncbi:putative RNA-directed DNA polymerase [Tanacetum coccineum]
MHMQEIVNQLPDAFTDTKRVTKSYILAVNAPARVKIPNVKSDDKVTQESKARLKRRRPVGSKDKNPRKRKATENAIIHEDIVLEGTYNVAPPEEEIDDINKEVSINYGIDYEETYSPVMDAITFRCLISLAIFENLDMRLMDVVTAYLYRSLDSDIYMKIPEGFKMPEALSAKPKGIKGYKSNLICHCVFIKKTTSGFVIIDVYVDHLNIIGTSKEINEVVVHLKEEFEMKDLGKTKYCLGLQNEHMPNGILVHQSNYTEKVLKRFNMDKEKSISTPMIGRSLNVDNDPFRPCEEDEDVLGPEVPYLSAIGALMYLTNYAGYLCDPHKARSQTGYVFLNGGTAISWRSQKQTLVATSSNHAEVIALHEASRECVWLRSMTQLIVTSCGLNKEKSPTIKHKDNAYTQDLIKDISKEGYIKSDRTKHILPRYFAYTQDLIKDNQIEINTWMAYGGNTRDLGSFGEETDEIMDLHQIHEEVLLTEHGDGVAGIKRRRRDPSSDGVRDLVTASGRSRLNEDLESST